MAKLLTESLFQHVLKSPLDDGFKDIHVVSGFVSPAFVRQVLFTDSSCSLKIIVGMVGFSGIASIDHNGFRNLEREIAVGRFECFYYSGARPCHIKALSLRNTNNMQRGFVGSSNFTWNGFHSNLELMIETDGSEVFALHSELMKDCISCMSDDADQFIRAASDTVEARAVRGITPAMANAGIQEVEVSLLKANGEIHDAGGGLNWGQPTPTRIRGNRNEAYISVPTQIHKDHPGFFPSKNQWFLAQTDDGELLWFSIRSGATEQGKDLATPDSNAKLGMYLRRRLGIPDGAPFTKGALNAYGRTSVTFKKLADDLFYIDFSPKK